MASSSSQLPSSSSFHNERKRDSTEIEIPELEIPECPICTESYILKPPICLTTCGHTVCKTCLAKILEENPAKCPKCRVKIPRANIDSFPINWDLRDILQKIDGLKEEARRKRRLANRRLLISSETIDNLGPEPMLSLLSNEFQMREPEKFCQLLKSTGSMIAGGVTLFALCRDQIPKKISSIWGCKTDLDVWIPHNPRRLEAAEPFHELLLDSGYEFKRRIDIENTEYKRLKLFVDHISHYEHQSKELHCSEENSIQMVVLKKGAEVIKNIEVFDIDVCRVAFDGEKFKSLNGDIYNFMKLPDNVLGELHFREWPRTITRLSKYVGRGFDLDLHETLKHYAKLVAKSIFSRGSTEFFELSKWIENFYGKDEVRSPEHEIQYFRSVLYSKDNILAEKDMVHIDYLSKTVSLVAADGSIVSSN